MFSHAMAVSGVHGLHASIGFTLLLLLVHFATPGFIAMFGAMLEVAYFSKVKSGNGGAAVLRLTTRALQCYLLYEVTVFALLLAGKSDLFGVAQRIVLMGYMPVTGILRFYIFALLCAPLVLAARQRFGLTPLLITAVLIHCAYPLLRSIPDLPDMPGGYYVFRILDTIYGAGDAAQVPSLIHGFTLIVFGMALGKATRDWTSGDAGVAKSGRRLMWLLIAVAGLPTLAMWNWQAPWQTVEALAFGEFRNVQHPMYYASGMLGIALAVMAFTYLLDFRKMRFGAPILFMGRTSLFTFSLGNCILFFAPTVSESASLAFALSLFLLGLVCLQSYAFDRLQRAKAGAQAGHGALRWAQNQLARLTRATSGFVSGFAGRYSRVLRLA
jgi:hypothetical protein